jgi:hypothetical protein
VLSAHNGHPVNYGNQQITTTGDHLNFADLPHLGDVLLAGK